MITSETLTTKIQQLRQDQEQLVAQLNMLIGAQRAFEALLAELAAPVSSTEPLVPES